MILRLERLQSGYGHSQVLFDLSLSIEAGQVVSVMGRNGMGKTTTIKTVMGLLATRSGSATFNGKLITGLKPESIARLGLGLVPEGRQIFPTLTVRENLIATAADRDRAASPWTIERIYALFPRLKERARQYAGTLSGGEQQMLAIGRALMTNPKLLILDEATEGLAPLIRADIWNCVIGLKEAGLAILIVDKNLAALRRIADRHFVIEKGRIVWEGPTDELDRDRNTVDRFLSV